MESVRPAMSEVPSTTLTVEWNNEPRGLGRHVIDIPLIATPRTIQQEPNRKLPETHAMEVPSITIVRTTKEEQDKEPCLNDCSLDRDTDTSIMQSDYVKSETAMKTEPLFEFYYTPNNHGQQANQHYSGGQSPSVQMAANFDEVENRGNKRARHNPDSNSDQSHGHLSILVESRTESPQSGRPQELPQSGTTLESSQSTGAVEMKYSNRVIFSTGREHLQRIVKPKMLKEMTVIDDSEPEGVDNDVDDDADDWSDDEEEQLSEKEYGQINRSNKRTETLTLSNSNQLPGVVPMNIPSPQIINPVQTQSLLPSSFCLLLVSGASASQGMEQNLPSGQIAENSALAKVFPDRSMLSGIVMSNFSGEQRFIPNSGPSEPASGNTVNIIYESAVQPSNSIQNQQARSDVQFLGLDERPLQQPFVSDPLTSNVSNSRRRTGPANTVRDRLPKREVYFSMLNVAQHALLRANFGDSLISVKCDLCSTVFVSLGSLGVHLETYHGASLEEPFKCEACQKTFGNRIEHSEHIPIHRLGGDYQCRTCGLCFKTDKQCRAHINLHKPIYGCVTCGMRFTVASAIREHLTSSKDHKAEHQCHKCYRVMKSDRDLQKHLVIHEKGMPYKCSLCDYSCIEPSAMKNHSLTHFGVKEKKCPLCDKLFLDIHRVRQHIRTVHEEKSFLCYLCGLACATNAKLRKHMISHEGKTQECLTCGKKYVGEKGLEAHMALHSGEGKYQCEVCGKKFVCPTNLKSHMDSHSDKMPFKCSHCGKKFKRKHNLKSHMRTHTKERDFGCEICGERFRWKHNMENHLKTHTGEKR